MNGLALCSGFGGIERGLESRIDGFKTICHVEGEAYAVANLVKKIQEGAIHEAPIWSNVQTFDGTPWRGKLDIITGGFPCQPHSSAGKLLGQKDPRNLWPDVKRIIGEVSPALLFLENVSNINNTIGPSIVADLAEMGYDSAWCVVRASDVGAPHRRARWFIMAHAHGESSNSELSRTHRKVPSKGRRLQTRKDQREAWCKSGCESKNDDANTYNSNESNMRIHESFEGSSKLEKVTLSDTDSERSGKSRKIQERSNGKLSGSESEKRAIDLSNTDRQRAERLGLKLRPRPLFKRYIDAESIESRRFEDWWAVEPPVGRMVDGVAHWVDRLRGCGNGVVPQQAAYAFDILSTALMNQMEGEI